MRKAEVKQSAKTSALSKVQINHRIKTVRLSIKAADDRIHTLNRHSRSTGTKIPNLSKRQFVKMRESLRHQRRKLERELRDLKRVRHTL